MRTRGVTEHFATGNDRMRLKRRRGFITRYAVALKETLMPKTGLSAEHLRDLARTGAEGDAKPPANGDHRDRADVP
jgi:hypothetical protein